MTTKMHLLRPQMPKTFCDLDAMSDSVHACEYTEDTTCNLCLVRAAMVLESIRLETRASINTHR